MKDLILFYFSTAIFLSCSKEKVSVLFTKIETQTICRLNQIAFTDAMNGYIVGGDRYFIGIYLKTTDGGQTWTAADSIISKELYGIHCIDADTVFAVGFDGKIMRTFNGGAHWFYNQLDYTPCYEIEFFNRQLGVIPTGTGYAIGGYYVTHDGGIKWQYTGFERELRSVSFTPSGTCFISGYGVVLRSTDFCQTFLPLEVEGDFFLDIEFPTESTGYVAGYHGDLYTTTNGGDQWDKIQLGSSVFDQFNIWDINFLNENTGFLVGDHGLFFKTVNGGKSWMKPAETPRENFRSIFLFDEYHGFVCGENGALFEFEFNL